LVTRGFPTESARNGQTPKIQTRLSATTRHSALSGRVIQTFPRDGDVYTKLPSSEKSTHSLFFLIIVCLGLTRLAASLLAQDKNRKTAENLLYLSVLALPCIAVIPGAIETRFFLPIYCISYCALAFESIKHKTVVGQLICAAILVTGIFCFAETSMQSPNYARPESYLASPPDLRKV
ncbi:hypothetical protein LYZ82_24285, partial [Xanthomonas hortorum pv. hederae]|nr:hypothetical protein [Xanthomonas hortorum pv. hederae]